MEARRRKAKGWYNTRTGEVVVVLSNNRDAEDVAATVAHETIGHKGLRELVGEENWNAFLDEVYKHLNRELKAEVDLNAGQTFIDDVLNNGENAKSYEEHRRVQVDELFARLAEKPFEDFSEGERTLWQKLKETVRRLLDRFLETMKLPKWFELGDNELRYILWRSKERLERGREDYVDKARDTVKRTELGLNDEAVYSGKGKRKIVGEDDDIKAANQRFNEELRQQMDGTLPKGHVYQIGRPGAILRSVGMPNLPIELVASKLSDKSMQENHPFELSEVNGLVNAIQNPLAVFRSATKIGSHVVLTEIKHGDKSFVVAIETNRSVGKIYVNSIRSVHYRKSMNILGWIEDGLTDYVSDLFKERWMSQTKIELLSKPQYNSADVRKKLNSVAKILKNFENPPISGKNFS